MARGGDDSDEERHDRFRSERSTTSNVTAPVASSKRYDLNSRPSVKRYDDRRSRERDRSRNHRSRERDSGVNRRYEIDTEYRRRRSKSGDDRGRDRESKSPKEPRRSHKDRNHRDKRSSDDKSDSRSSHESHWEKRKHKHSKRNRDPENTKSIGMDTFAQKYDRRRESSVEEIVDDDDVIFRDSSSSPDRERSKNRKNGEKERKKEKRKEKKKKREICDKSRSTSPIPLMKTESYGPKKPEPPMSRSEIIRPSVPSAVLQDSLPGNRSTLSPTPAEEEKDFYGPIIPPSLNRKEDKDIAEPQPAMSPSPEVPLDKKEADPPKTKERVYGPTLPERAMLPNVIQDDLSYGPALPPCLVNEPTLSETSETEEDSAYGPQPLGIGGRTQEELEIRAALIKRQLENKDVSAPKKREKWMTELPEGNRAALGLGPRKFKKRDGPDLSDRSSWTDTPEEKNRKLLSQSDELNEDDGQLDSKRLGIMERDKEMEKRARQGKKRDKSLLEMHQKTLKKKKKKEKKEKEAEPERRPFNREIDLQTNRFDEAQKRSIIKKAQLLNSRFSSGESKYL